MLVTNGIPPHQYRFHFVGIAGTGMAGIAEILLQRQYQVSGSDLACNAVTQRLREQGAVIYQGHAAHHVQGAHRVVFSSAVPADNPECVAARFAGVPVISRAHMLASLMYFHCGIAISGTHGKTTTTALTVSLFESAQVNPAFVVGGKVAHLGVQARGGARPYFIVEADESDASFLLLQPTIAVVTNIDRDHLEAYSGNFQALKRGFLDFLHRLPFYGVAVLCRDDPVVTALLPQIARTVVTYGFDPAAHWRIVHYQQMGRQAHVRIKAPPPHGEFTFTLPLCGRHNVQNAVAALIVSQCCHLPPSVLETGFMGFQGVERRFHDLGEWAVDGSARTVRVLDDYGHHPTELQAVIDAVAQRWPGRRCIMLFQPHRYTRTQLLFADFVQVLSRLSGVLLLDIYAAGEPPIVGINSPVLCEAIRKKWAESDASRQQQTAPQAHCVCAWSQAKTVLAQLAHHGDVVVFQGAGSISQWASQCQKEVTAHGSSQCVA